MLIWLTGVLIFLAIFPAIDFVMKVTGEHERPAPIVAAPVPAAKPISVETSTTTVNTAPVTATTATTVTTSTAAAPQKVVPKSSKTEKKP